MTPDAPARVTNRYVPESCSQARLTHGGLFEGYGGTTMAAETVLGPLDRRWHSDIKPASIALLEHRHPDVPNLGDLTAIDWSSVEPVDVLTASWPCQPHSSAGKRLGEEDPRALWPHVADAIAAVRPRYFFGENVARIAGNGELRRVARSLADLGYVGAWRCRNASDEGAPHRRSRCFVVAVDSAAADTLTAGRTPGLGLGGPAGQAAVGDDHATGDDRLTLLPTPTQNMTTGAGTSGRDGGMNLQTAALEVATDWREYEPAIRRWERVLGRPAPAPTVPSLRKPYGPQLSARFAEWMMGLPDGWVTEVESIATRPAWHRNAALSLLGDGVVPQQGAAAFAACLDDLAASQAAA